MLSLAPPARRCSGSPVLRARRSQRAVSIAARAIEVSAPTVVRYWNSIPHFYPPQSGDIYSNRFGVALRITHTSSQRMHMNDGNGDRHILDDDELIDLDETRKIMGGVSVSSAYANAELMALKISMTPGAAAPVWFALSSARFMPCAPSASRARKPTPPWSRPRSRPVSSSAESGNGSAQPCDSQSECGGRALPGPRHRRGAGGL
jgi:hypothetical protein